MDLGRAAAAGVEDVGDEAAILIALGDVDAGVPVAMAGRRVVERRPVAPGRAAVVGPTDDEAVGIVLLVDVVPADREEVPVGGHGEIGIVSGDKLVPRPPRRRRGRGRALPAASAPRTGVDRAEAAAVPGDPAGSPGRPGTG